MPGTQGLYGFVIGLLVLAKLDLGMSLAEDYIYLQLVYQLVLWDGDQLFLREKFLQRYSILAKNEEQSTKGIIYAVMVETYALLAFVISLLLTNAVSF